MPRYLDDFSALAGSVEPKDFWDPVKFIPFDKEKNIYLSLGGEARLTYEFYENNLFGAGPQDNGGFFLQRYLLHADFHVAPSFRSFVQLQSSLIDGRRGGPRPVDRDELDLHQTFAEWTPLEEDFKLSLRVGRQELNYGSGRLVTFRDGPNNRLAFEAVVLTLARPADQWSVDGFVGRPLETDARAFDNQTLDTESLWGLYATTAVPGVQGLKSDLYFLGFDRDPSRFNEGIRGETRYSLGSRLHGRWAGVDMNLEGLYQFGNFGEGNLSAWTFASDNGYTWSQLPGKPRLGMKANIASGDETSGDGNLNTFNALYPRGGYFGEIGLIGPANFYNFHPNLSFVPAKGLRVSTDAIFFWRQSLNDGIYGPSGNLIRAAGTSQADYIGTQIDFSIHWQIDPHWSCSFEYAHFSQVILSRTPAPPMTWTLFNLEPPTAFDVNDSFHVFASSRLCVKNSP
ncbi:MAG: alginate export family protein [Blastochloris sp.]|nr:alginate export family protein [Blastochloris sp.]